MKNKADRPTVTLPHRTARLRAWDAFFSLFTLKNKAEAPAPIQHSHDTITIRVVEGCLVLVPLLLIAIWLDPRHVLGLDPWIKPLKFVLSIGIYLLTIEVLCRTLHRPWMTQLVRVVASLAMSLEIVLISFQAGRGTQSHFNNATELDRQIHGYMKWGVVANTVALLVLLVAFLGPRVPAPTESDRRFR